MKPELLAPVGNWAMINAAINAGADAIYFGIEDLNMRHSAKNFSLNDLKKIGELKIKKYLTLNTIIYDEELNKVEMIIKQAKDAGIDAIICWDMAVLNIAQKIGIDVHLSTQASISNSSALEFYRGHGVTRFILARELSLNQIKKIKKKTNVEVEVFIHGAMCVSISGRCFMSHFLEHKSANRGRCFQPCRRPYIVKDKETGYHFNVGNNFIMSPKDLCALPIIEKLIEANIDVFKIEGRAKSPEYVDIVVRVYRKAIDAYYNNKLNHELKSKLLENLKQAYNRKFSTGFFETKPLIEWANSEGNESKVIKLEVGKIINYYKNNKVAVIKVQAESFKKGDTLLVIGSTSGVIRQKVETIEEDHKEIGYAKKGSLVAVKFNYLVRENDKVYKLII